MASAFRTAFARSAFRRSPIRQIFQRRAQTTAASDATAGAEEQSRFQKLWNSKVGPKTVHFWAPIMKWGLVIAGASDFARPAEMLSLQQNFALMCTGAIWTRWCFVIRPQNFFLASVNALLFCVGATQVGRIMSYRQSLTDKPLTQQISETGDQLKESAKDVANKPQQVLGK